MAQLPLDGVRARSDSPRACVLLDVDVARCVAHRMALSTDRRQGVGLCGDG